MVWAQPEKIAQAQIYVSRGEPNLALDEIEPVIKFFEPMKKVSGSWWLLREIEMSAATADAVELSSDKVQLVSAKFYLPASKTDSRAAGVRRSLS